MGAQDSQLKFDRISVEDGLSQSSVLCMIQDHKGFMWFGTLEGLNKFDGYNFTIFKSDLDDPSSISSNYIYSIYEDNSGVIWVGTNEGLNRFDRETEQFSNYKYNPGDNNCISDNSVLCIYGDVNGILWIGTKKGGLNRFDPNTGIFKHFLKDQGNANSLSNNAVNTVILGSNGKLWIGTDDGLNEFDPETESFASYNYIPKNPFGLKENRILSLNKDKTGILWLGTFSLGLGRFDPESGKFTYFRSDMLDSTTIESSTIRVVFEDKEGSLWVGTSNGLEEFDREKGHFNHYKHDGIDSKSISHNNISSIYQDISGILWVGTYAGLNKADRKKVMFQHFNQTSSGLNNNMVYSIFEDEHGTLWIGTYGGGLNRFDKESITHFKNNPEDPTSLSLDRIFSIHGDNEGTLWIGTSGRGLDKFDYDNGEFKHFMPNPNDPKSISGYSVFSICEENSNTFWIGTGKGLNKFNVEEEEFSHYLHNKNDSNSISDDLVYAVHLDRSGTLWVGTNDGLNRFVSEKEQFVRYRNNEDNPNTISDNSVSSIYEDMSGRLWIGTYSGGLNMLDKQRNYFKRYGEKEGLPSTSINGIVEDKNNHLWISTNKGLSRLNPETGEVRNYGVENGLQSLEFSGGAYFKNKEGEIYFGGINGFNVFHPDSIKDNTYSPPVVITCFRLFNQLVPIQYDENEKGEFTTSAHISELDEIVLSYKENFFSFEFSALHYSSPEKIMYAYMMEGFNDDWVYTDSKNRIATYTNLNPGEYSFIVESSNCDGIWNGERASIKIIITPPFWKTWYAYTLFSVIFITSTLGFFYWRTYLLRKRKEELQKEVKRQIKKLKNTNKKLELNQKELLLTEFSVDSSTDFFYIVDLESAKIIKFNSQASKRLGYSTEEFSNMYIFDIDPDPQFFAKNWPEFSNQLAKSKKMQFETFHRTKNGIVFPVEVSANFLEYQNRGYICAIVRDITERKKAEEELRQFKLFADTSIEGFGMADLDSRILYQNKRLCDLCGIEKAAINEPFLQFYPKESKKKLKEKIIPELIKKGYWRGELDHLTGSGGTFPTFHNFFVIKDEKGQPYRLAATITDITERKKAESELKRSKEKAEEANRTKSAFLANMSHEIRTPMNSILGFSEILSNKITDTKHKSYLDSIYTSGKNLLTLINDILDLSKVEAGKVEIIYESVNTRSFLDEINNIFQAKIEEKGLEYHINIDKNLSRNIYADELRLRQIIINLLSNAVKFTQKGYIKFSVEQDVSQMENQGKTEDEFIDILIKVEDTGIGISRTFLAKMFKTFEQEDSQISRKFGGTGLGLAISKRLAEMMNGDILVDSEPEKGSTFTLWLKEVKVSKEIQELEVDSIIKADQVKFQSNTVFVAGDNEEIRKYFSEVLSDVGLKVRVFINGKKLLEQAKKESPDLIITDINMPVMDGYELVEKLKNDPKLRNIPVFAATASVMKDSMEKIKEHKFDSLLIKPILLSDLYAELMKFLSHQRLDERPEIITDPVEDSFDDSVKNLIPEVVKKLEGEFMKTWEAFEEKQPMNDVTAFGSELKKLGEQYKIKFIYQYGDSLLSAVESFDIDRMQRGLKEFPKMIEQIKSIK